MAQRKVVVGTTPTLLADYNAKRAAISITFSPTNIEAGNTGNLFVGKGFPPVNTVGSPQQGDVLQQAGGLVDSKKFENDTSVFKGQWWATASIANQVVVVDEASTTD